MVLLEDDHGVRRSLQMLLQGRGFDVKAYGGGETLLADPRPIEADCLIVDLHLGAADGIAVLEALRARGWTGPAVLITAFGSAEVSARAAAAGFAEVLEKPMKDRMLVATLERLLG